MRPTKRALGRYGALKAGTVAEVTTSRVTAPRPDCRIDSGVT
jgi:hypothetical protein